MKDLMPILFLGVLCAQACANDVEPAIGDEIDPVVAAQIEEIRALERRRTFNDYKRERAERRKNALYVRRQLNARKRYYPSATPSRPRVAVPTPMRTPYIKTRYVNPNALSRYGYR